MDEKINNQILAGDITALTIDTSIFEKNGLALESGLLAQLEQFRESEFELVIANTVANEVKRHLAKNATDATKALRTALTHTAKHRALSSEHQEELTALSALAIADDDVRARKRFDDWAQRVGAEVILENEFASIGEVMRRYEAGEPPFAETGEKKQEFPDAVALSTLEGWAEDRDTRILAVAHDKDWQRYGAQSKRLVVVDDLAAALSTIQGLGAAREPAVRLAALFVAGDAVGLHAAVLEAIRHQVDKFEFRVEADSQFAVEEEGVEATVEDVSLDIPDATGTTLDTISRDGGQAVIKVGGVAMLGVHVHFSFEKFDSVDRDYMSMGSATIPVDVEIEFEALVTVQIDADGLTLDSVELLPVTHHMYFNDIEPDWMSDPDNYDTYDRD
ncbi:PIN domain-containing protein [Ralstonia sp. UNC404CL21Col]|uniref:PIN domain-containing protein n=1 Tax=Ralstonia sp. UNC404CL21Col TaxID=1380362 RepID=UPI0012DC8561|nr:PIN domain-containing protein [Ralstonia sp. UNC404CL21Col]